MTDLVSLKWLAVSLVWILVLLNSWHWSHVTFWKHKNVELPDILNLCLNTLETGSHHYSGQLKHFEIWVMK